VLQSKLSFSRPDATNLNITKYSYIYCHDRQTMNKIYTRKIHGILYIIEC